jgi:hypothetical protein
MVAQLWRYTRSVPSRTAMAMYSSGEAATSSVNPMAW